MKNGFTIILLALFALTFSVQTMAAPEGNLSSISLEDPGISSLKLYPNPTTQFFQINNDQDVTSLSVYSLIGKELLTTAHTVGNRYDVSDYRNGIYLVRLLDKDGEVLKVLRLSKR
jgi:hypothetical protein